ncbi:MAG: hypothetical protein QG657_1462 [Acidobacteriota bacterium]|nr:hypothetical protein [Acidobacteriota bacterium]
MHFLPYLHFFVGIVYMYLAVFIFIKNPKGLVNRILAVLFLCLSFWSFSMIFMHAPHCQPSTAWIANNIGSLGWISFSSFFLWFMLAFTGKENILKKKWLYLILLGIPALLIYKQWTNSLYVDLVKVSYGWRSQLSGTIWPSILHSYYLIFMLTAIYINFDFMRKTRNTIARKQAKIILIAVAIVLILGSLTDVILPRWLKIYSIPNMADFFVLFLAVGVVYAIARYRFLTITSATAAENIISTMFDSLILLNLEGNIVTLNKAAAGLSGYEENELIGKTIAILFPGTDSENHPVKEIIQEKDLKSEEFVLKTKNGKDIPVLLSSSILKDEAGKAGGIVCVAKDISERIKLEEEILKSKKLESIGFLAGGIAHDFNNLLGIIIGNLNLAREELPGGTQTHKLLVGAEEASQKAIDLTRKFMSFSRGSGIKKEKVILANIFKNVEKEGLLVLNSKKNIDFQVVIPQDLAPVKGDEARLTQVMQNLFQYAVEAVPEGRVGRISVWAENITLEQHQGDLPLKKGKYVKIFIEDNGIGIPKANIGKIFDPYFSTKDNWSQKGMGLGLTICYSIIQKHEGYIAVESQQGIGTTFTLYLPAFIDAHG